MKSPLRLAVLAALIPLVLTTLVACAPTVALTSAKGANDAACANVTVRLPPSLGSWAIRQTDAQATGAWGNPVVAVLKCGVTPPGPTTDLCYTVSGIDWVEDKTKAPTYVFTTFGRTPAVQLTIDSRATNGEGTILLDELSSAVITIPQSAKHKCTDVLGSQDLPTATPAPTP